MVTLLDFVHKCRARWGGGAEPARRPDGLGRFFFTGVAEENWDVYPHLDEITGNDHIDRLQTGSGRERSESRAGASTIADAT